MRFVTFSTFLSLQYLLSLSGFTSCILLCTELGRTFWPSPPKMGVALTGLSTEYVNIRKCAFFRCTRYQHFVFYRIFHRKGEFHFWQKLVHTVWKNRLWKSDWLKIALCYVKVRLPGLTLFRMEQKLWSSSAQVSWSLFKHLVASREDFKLNFLNWTSLCPIPSLHPNKTKQNQKTTNQSADCIAVLSMNVQKAKNCSFLVPCCFSPKSAERNWLKIAKQ